jgi:NAD(P)-dependent dehydrogenase (short-subunit alcohol dehydrogenase family)
VVTGAASGIGRAIAERCAREGMKVVLAGINRETLRPVELALTATGATAISVPTDVSKREDVEALAQRTLDAFGAVHLLVNNAGVSAGSSVWESTWNDWEWVLSVNLWGVLHGIKAFLPHMLAQDAEGHVVNVASVSGLVAYHPTAPYQVTKAAVVALSENLYRTLADRNARVGVSVLCPGWVRSAIVDSRRNRPAALDDPPTPLAPERQTWRAAARASVEAGMSPEEVADQAFNAIREDRLYVLTHPEFTPHIEERVRRILTGQNPADPHWY